MWFAPWWGTRQAQNVPGVIDNLAHMYSWNASFNIYMIHGGTNFGFMNSNPVRYFVKIEDSLIFRWPLLMTIVLR